MNKCDFEEELIEFLCFLETRPQPLELIIVGDTFAFWEITTGEGPAKLEVVLEHHPRLFEQFRQSGAKYAITLIPGNHDHDLAAYPEFITQLAKYNLNLNPQRVLLHSLGSKQIWIEHGSQYDQFNSAPEFGNPHANPLGYWVTSKVVSTARKKAELAKHKWLKDIQSVYPGELIPHWLFVNYFYKEMGLWLRFLVYPFLTLFFLIILAFGFVLLEQTPALEMVLGEEMVNNYAGWLGQVSGLAEFLTVLAIYYLLAVGLAAMPLGLLGLDIWRALKRYGLPSLASFKKEKEDVYRLAAEKVFAEHPEVSLFIYGHTHKPAIERVGEKLILNTGTWLKRLQRIPARVFFLPDIYYPSYRLNYFRVGLENQALVVDYQVIPKMLNLEQDLTWLQRRLVSRKYLAKKQVHLPRKVKIDQSS